MSDPMVLIEDKAGREYQVLKSNFERLYADAGYEITRIVGVSEGDTEYPPAEVADAQATAGQDAAAAQTDAAKSAATQAAGQPAKATQPAPATEPAAANPAPTPTPDGHAA